MRRLMTAAALTALLAAGCGTGEDDGGVATLADGKGGTPTASVDPEDAFRQYARCMREQGVDIPDPGAGDEPVMLAPSGPSAQYQAADRKCGPILKKALRDGPKMDDPAMLDNALKFARCMREHGIDLPDPGADGAIRKPVDGGEGSAEPAVMFDPDDPKLKAAQRACGHLFGAAQPAPEPK